MSLGDIGLIGLAVMGQNLVLNMAEKGWSVVVYNRTPEKVEQFLSGPAERFSVIGAESLQDFIQKLKRPRKIFLMIKAGEAVDSLVEQLLPLLESGDIILDGGNSHYVDTERRVKALAGKGILFMGVGVSGGEEGARHGPSIMPGGNPAGWDFVKEILQSIAAKAQDGQPCCYWVGNGGAGHYVKMVHNGIEYGDMQLIGEAYHLLREVGKLNYEELQKVFSDWNKGVLQSYLIEITADILGHRNEQGEMTLDTILDAAGQKGTGKWTGCSALELGEPVTLIAEAVFARCLSSKKGLREIFSKKYTKGLGGAPDLAKKDLIACVHDALYASKIVSYAQGLMLMQAAAAFFSWELQYGAIALLWREGCIIRSAFLEDIYKSFEKNPTLESILLDDFFAKALSAAEAGWRATVVTAVRQGIAVPCFSTALSFFDGITTERLPANLLQAQRDYFGAHTYEKVGSPRGMFFHTDWMGSAGESLSKTYNL